MIARQFGNTWLFEKAMSTSKSLPERLKEGIVFCGEGYLFGLEKRGYVQVGPYVPTVVLDYPGAVKELHREFMRCGSDVVPAFTYWKRCALLGGNINSKS